MKGRPIDPKRSKRQTGHRRKPNEAPKLKVVALPVQLPGLEPPETLPDEMVPTWHRVIELVGKNGLRDQDVFGIELLVRQFHRAAATGAMVDQYGVFAKSSRGDVIVSPFLKAERDASAMFLRFAEHYGMTVASRMRLGLMQLAGKTMAQMLEDELAGHKD